MTDRAVFRNATAVILFHALINLAHGAAHHHLGVAITESQLLFVALVSGIAPFIALALFWRSAAKPAAVLLGISMAASLLFGAYYHYVAVSPDHIAHLPSGDVQGVFRLTAFLLTASQLLGLTAAMWILIRPEHQDRERV